MAARTSSTPLTQGVIANLTEAHRYPDGKVPGLFLRVNPGGSKSWILRLMVDGKRRDMGLGGWSAVPVAEARKKALARTRKTSPKKSRRREPQIERVAAPPVDVLISELIADMRSNGEAESFLQEFELQLRKQLPAATASPEIVSEWHDAYREHNWDAIANWWTMSVDRVAKAALLIQLRHDVPRLRICEGMEEHDIFINPMKTRQQWESAPGRHGAAEILLLGELEADVMGEPTPARLRWRDHRMRVEAILHELAGDAATLAEASEISQEGHAKAALDLLTEIRFESLLMMGEIDPTDDHPEDRDWLEELIASISVKAFEAGRHSQTAAGKRIEDFAVTGKKIKDGVRLSAELTNRQQEAVRKRRFARLKELIPEMGLEAAARQCESEELGDRDAIKRQWNRHRET